jgi:hypothetical protein
VPEADAILTEPLLAQPTRPPADKPKNAPDSDMRRLLALPAAETPEFSKLTNRLLAASLQSNHEFF